MTSRKRTSARPSRRSPRWRVQALQNALPGCQATCLVSRTLVSAEDPAFASPSKLVGPVYDDQQAHQLADAHGWDIGKDGPWWRRIIASPEPVELLDLPLIRTLHSSGVIIVCARQITASSLEDRDGRGWFLPGMRVAAPKDTPRKDTGYWDEGGRVLRASVRRSTWRHEHAGWRAIGPRAL
ncbi:MAG TPA: hypothetical protein VGA04_24910 [Streptosporangiaceae bacterium]